MSIEAARRAAEAAAREVPPPAPAPPAGETPASAEAGNGVNASEQAEAADSGEE
jgi:hypothetical protein